MPPRTITRGLQGMFRPCTCPRSAAPTYRFTSTSAKPKSTSDLGVPIDSAVLSIKPGPIGRSRLQHHYETQLAPDLLYMSWQLPLGHALDGSTPLTLNDGRALTSYPDPVSKLPQWDPGSLYSDNRPRRKPRGPSGAVTPKAPGDATPENIPRLEKICLDIHVPQAIQSNRELLGAIMLLQFITGEPDRAGLPPHVLASLPPDRGIRVVRTKDASTSFKVRRDQPCGVSVSLKGPQMYAFLDTLTTFVLPRMKDYSGFRLPPQGAHTRTPMMNAGVVQVGLPADAMGLWPGVEDSMENWPRQYGMNIHFVTNARGTRAQDRARALISGFRVPFVTSGV